MPNLKMPQTAPPEYKYTPLPCKSSIRLIKVHPQLQAKRLACSLELFQDHEDDDDDDDSNSSNNNNNNNNNPSPEYVALSYVWGDATPRHPIYINGLLRLVHTNLWLFLRRAWINNATDWFWIDALCLNQHSHSELNVQVARIGDIYARACHVVSWLGESEKGVDALHIMTDLLATQRQQAEAGSQGVYVLDMRTPAAQRLDRAWTQLVRLQGSEYWQRAWVLQEVACAKTSSVVYGPVAVDFEELLQCQGLESLYQFWSTGTQEGPFSVAAEWIGKLYALRREIKAGGRIGLAELLEKLTGASSTRLADRVYGLIGLFSRLDPDFDPDRLEIDYDKDLETIAWDVILLTMENTPSSLWKDFHHTITRTFQALDLSRRIAPPRKHHNFAATSHTRRARTGRICQIHDAIVSSGPWAAGLGERSLDSVFGATAALEQVLSHVCTSRICSRQRMENEKCADAVLSLSLIICETENMDIQKDSFSKVDNATTSNAEALPWLCEAHLPQHLQRSVRLRRKAHRRTASKTTARVQQLQPVTTASRDEAYWAREDMLPRCKARSSESSCEDSTVYLEIPELALVLRSHQDTSERGPREGSPGIRTPVYGQWFCTACPLLWGAMDESIHAKDSTAQLASVSETSLSAMPTIPERSPHRAPSVRSDSAPPIEESHRRFMSSADFPWGRRPSLMEAWKEHRAKGTSRASHGHNLE